MLHMSDKDILNGRLRSGMTFEQKVWALTARVPKGRVTTYGAIARKLRTKAYRAVGRALHHNPYAPKVPCHRVVGSDGALTGFAGGLAKKRAMLEAEGVSVCKGKVDRSVMTEL
ncbi:MAG: cysteine methyltransferase [Phycisphaeraceae bacterium]|nr:cysteine methyltransferase [Phycisphaeraceae bacterium]